MSSSRTHFGIIHACSLWRGNQGFESLGLPFKVRSAAQFLDFLWYVKKFVQLDKLNARKPHIQPVAPINDLFPTFMHIKRPQDSSHGL